VADRPLYPINRRHLEVLTGPLGIWQHAAGRNPNETFGYCTDDVARALAADLLHSRELGWEAVRESAWRSLRFLGDAFVASTGRFRNFRARDGSWLEAVGSEDCQGRAMHALGSAIAGSPEAAFVAESRTLFGGALTATGALTSLRAVSSAVLGCDAVLRAGPDARTQATFEGLAARLSLAFASCANDREWPWPEATLTYESALLPEALIAAGSRLGGAVTRRTGLDVLDWLGRCQTASHGFSPVGNDGWWPSGGTRSPFDQQPIEATSMILAAAAAFDETGEERYSRAVESAYAWFLGDNEVGVAVADPATGGCHDGLTTRGVNMNEGAESTLMWQIALERVRIARSEATLRRRRGRRATVTAPAIDAMQS
jgi:hypothetical protein